MAEQVEAEVRRRRLGRKVQARDIDGVHDDPVVVLAVAWRRSGADVTVHARVVLQLHGTVGQTRALIHIRDTVRCIELALNNPPQAGGRPQVLNQVTETHQVGGLAKLVADIMGADIAYLPNPRQEAEENELIVRNDQFLALGLEPTTLSDGLLEEGKEIARRYRDRVDPSKIIARSVWRKGMETAEDLISDIPDEG